MGAVATKVSLSAGRRRLLEVLQEINFGRIEALVVRNGEPVLAPDTRVVREVRFGSENGPRRELSIGDFVLKAQVVELFDLLDRMDNGMVERLEVKHGLPFRVDVQEPVRA